MSDLHPVRRALLSVHDKRGIVELARFLADAGVELLSTGGTWRLLHEAGLAVTEVAEHTGFPEMMDGRVKTLHPRIHGGILGRRDANGGGVDAAVMAEHDIAPIDLVIVNLYPFRETVARPDASAADIIENIDIGGPAMLRSAAKNHASVAVLVSPDDYDEVRAELAANDLATSLDLRRRLAGRAFRHTAAYDAAIAGWFASQDQQADARFPEELTLSWQRVETLRYGENPHQRAAVYREGPPRPGTALAARRLQGKAMSFCNVMDADAALECVKVFQQPACVIVKHANPCGVALAATPLAAYERAFATDPTSAFGGIIAFNRPLDEACATAIAERQVVDVVIAPVIEPGAREALKRRRNARVLECGELTPLTASPVDVKKIADGLLVQDRDLTDIDPERLRVVTRREPSAAEMQDLRFAWQVAWFVKSNAIVYARDGATVGVGAGQMARVISARIASMKAADANLEVPGAVMASDAFFPFRDGIDAAAEAGITAVIQPGGSIRDAEVIEAADEHGMAMLFTDIRHFRH